MSNLGNELRQCLIEAAEGSSAPPPRENSTEPFDDGGHRESISVNFHVMPGVASKCCVRRPRSSVSLWHTIKWAASGSLQEGVERNDHQHLEVLTLPSVCLADSINRQHARVSSASSLMTVMHDRPQAMTRDPK